MCLLNLLELLAAFDCKPHEMVLKINVSCPYCKPHLNTGYQASEMHSFDTNQQQQQN